jgi:hypothetical protein
MMKQAKHAGKEMPKPAVKPFLFTMALMIIIMVCFALLKTYVLHGNMLFSANATYAANDTGTEYVRAPAVSGQFYPSGKGNLEMMVDSFLKTAEDKKLGTIKALLVPHAGYIYSGQVAAQGFKQLETQKLRIKKVFIVANNHASGAYYSGVSIPNFTHYETPLGKVQVSKIAKELSTKQPFTFNPTAHTAHVEEVEIPFLQRELGSDFEIIPMVIGSANQDTINDAAKAINDYIDDETLIVISSDLSHYYHYDDAVKLDTSCIAQIENQSFAGTSNCEACGRDAILIALRISEMNGWKAKIIDYKNSGDTAGDKSAVVGYSAIAFYTDAQQFTAEVVNPAEQKTLLKLARDAVETYVKEGKQPNLDNLDITDTMKEVRGCFVTLNENGQLRGCIGHIVPQKPLYECVIENAINAASADPRFPPVSEPELDDIEIDISVLTLAQKLEYDGPDDLLSKLRPNIDGVVLRSGYRQSTFLPQVWEMFANDKTAFLEALCKKQGSENDCWKSANVDVYQAQVFKEE